MHKFVVFGGGSNAAGVFKRVEEVTAKDARDAVVVFGDHWQNGFNLTVTGPRVWQAQPKEQSGGFQNIIVQRD